jgi:hypothetical protein
VDAREVSGLNEKIEMLAERFEEVLNRQGRRSLCLNGVENME